MGTAVITLESAAASGRRWLNQLTSAWHRRLSARAARCHLQIEQNAMLGNKATVSLVTVDGERVLVGVTGGCIRFHSLRSSAALEFPVGGAVK